MIMTSLSIFYVMILTSLSMFYAMINDVFVNVLCDDNDVFVNVLCDDNDVFVNVLCDDTDVFLNVLCDDTDVFVLLLYFYWKLDIKTIIFMQATSNERKVIDIRDLEIENIIPYILAAHAASGCDTVAPHHGIGKLTIITKLREGFRLDLLGNFSASLDTHINKVATLISSS